MMPFLVGAVAGLLFATAAIMDYWPRRRRLLFVAMGAALIVAGRFFGGLLP